MLSFVAEAVQKFIAFVDRHRAGTIVVVSLLILAASLTGVAALRPAPLAPALDAGQDLLMKLYSRPARFFTWLTAPRASSEDAARRRIQDVRLRELMEENLRLRELLRYEAPRGFQYRAGHVIRLDLSPVQGVARIDVGRGRDLTGGEPVVTIEGLVGVVDSVDARASSVRLLRNRDTPVAVRNVRSRVLGVADWDPAGRLHRVNYVPKQADFAVGDTLISSGLGGVFPPGLPVGTVESVEDPPESPVKEIRLRPFAPFFHLEEIFVLLPAPGDSILPEGDR